MLSLLALFLLQAPVVHSSCTFPCQITYAIADGPKHGDAQVCADAALTHCGRSVVAPAPIADALNPSPGGKVAVYVKAGSVPGQYTVSITMGGERKPQGSVPVWVGTKAPLIAPAVAAPKKPWYWPF